MSSCKWIVEQRVGELVKRQTLLRAEKVKKLWGAITDHFLKDTANKKRSMVALYMHKRLVN